LKNKNKKILIVLLFLIQATFAQTYEFDLNYGFGTSELSFNSVPGFALSIYPIEHFGFSAGLQYSWHWQTKTNGINDSINKNDTLIFRYKIDEYREKLTARILQVPLLLKYSNDSYYIGAGVKIGAVQKARANISYKGLKTEGYYPEADLTLTAPTFQGFGPQKDSSFTTKISSKKLIMLALESGLKLKLNDNFAMLAGIFADYSFNKGFNRDLKPVVERTENSNGAIIEVNDKWKSWKPWSIGIAVKFAIMGGYRNAQEEPPLVEEPATPPPPPQQPQPQPQEQGQNSFMPDLPIFLQNRRADFVFNFPENGISPTDSVHLVLISQIASVLRIKPEAQLHCIGYSEKLISESVAYETAFQRALGIRFTLARFYGIEERRISIYSQGLNNTGYRRAECFVIDTPP